MQTEISGKEIILEVGDITEQKTEAIVNAANSSLMGGGGVDGAIHSAGGPEILKECKEIRRKEGKCPPGESVITTAGKLQADYVIHTVGPVWNGGTNNEASVLESAYSNSLKLANKNNIKSISFPSISTGAYGYPMDKAAVIALSRIKKFAQKNELPQKIKMILYNKEDFNIYLDIWENVIIDD